MRSLAMAAAILGMAGMSGLTKPKKAKTIKDRGYTRAQRKEIEQLKLDRSSPGRKKLKQYYKAIHEGRADV